MPQHVQRAGRRQKRNWFLNKWVLTDNEVLGQETVQPPGGTALQTELLWVPGKGVPAEGKGPPLPEAKGPEQGAAQLSPRQFCPSTGKEAHFSFNTCQWLFPFLLFQCLTMNGIGFYGHCFQRLQHTHSDCCRRGKIKVFKIASCTEINI